MNENLVFVWVYVLGSLLHIQLLL